MSVAVGETVLLPEWGGTKIDLDEQVGCRVKNCYQTMLIVFVCRSTSYTRRANS